LIKWAVKHHENEGQPDYSLDGVKEFNPTEISLYRSTIASPLGK
jgi:hypothetical protein